MTNSFFTSNILRRRYAFYSHVMPEDAKSMLFSPPSPKRCVTGIVPGTPYLSSHFPRTISKRPTCLALILSVSICVNLWILLFRFTVWFVDLNSSESFLVNAGLVRHSLAYSGHHSGVVGVSMPCSIAIEYIGARVRISVPS